MYRPHKLRNRIIVLVVTVALIVAIIVGVVVWKGTPTLDVSNVSLKPNEIEGNSSATFSFTIKNYDAEKPHQVMIIFITLFYNPPVIFSQNNVPLPINTTRSQRTDNSVFQYLAITLQPSQKSTYSLKVDGVLIVGESTSTSSIRIEFFNENSTNFDTATESLKVNL